jgi:hypothetical protein
MSYSEFTNLMMVKKQFNLTLDEIRDLFTTVPEMAISEMLAMILAENIPD